MKRRIEYPSAIDVIVVATQAEHTNDKVARLGILTDSTGLDLHGDFETFALRVATQVETLTGTWPSHPADAKPAAANAYQLAYLADQYEKGLAESLLEGMLDAVVLLTKMSTKAELVAAGFDLGTSASSQHYIDTGRYLLT